MKSSHLIKAETNKKFFDIVNEIKSFLSLNSLQYMISENNKDRPILEEYLKFDNCNKSIICTKDFKLKNCIFI